MAARNRRGPGALAIRTGVSAVPGVPQPSAPPRPVQAPAYSRPTRGGAWKPKTPSLSVSEPPTIVETLPYRGTPLHSRVQSTQGGFSQQVEGSAANMGLPLRQPSANGIMPTPAPVPIGATPAGLSSLPPASSSVFGRESPAGFAADAEGADRGATAATRQGGDPSGQVPPPPASKESAEDIIRKLQSQLQKASEDLSGEQSRRQKAEVQVDEHLCVVQVLQAELEHVLDTNKQAVAKAVEHENDRLLNRISTLEETLDSQKRSIQRLDSSVATEKANSRTLRLTLAQARLAATHSKAAAAAATKAARTPAAKTTVQQSDGTSAYSATSSAGSKVVPNSAETSVSGGADSSFDLMEYEQQERRILSQSDGSRTRSPAPAPAASSSSSSSATGAETESAAVGDSVTEMLSPPVSRIRPPRLPTSSVQRSSSREHVTLESLAQQHQSITERSAARKSLHTLLLQERQLQGAMTTGRLARLAWELQSHAPPTTTTPATLLSRAHSAADESPLALLGVLWPAAGLLPLPSDLADGQMQAVAARRAAASRLSQMDPPESSVSLLELVESNGSLYGASTRRSADQMQGALHGPPSLSLSSGSAGIKSVSPPWSWSPSSVMGHSRHWTDYAGADAGPVTGRAGSLSDHRIQADAEEAEVEHEGQSRWRAREALLVLVTSSRTAARAILGDGLMVDSQAAQSPHTQPAQVPSDMGIGCHVVPSVAFHPTASLQRLGVIARPETQLNASSSSPLKSPGGRRSSVTQQPAPLTAPLDTSLGAAIRQVPSQAHAATDPKWSEAEKRAGIAHSTTGSNSGSSSSSSRISSSWHQTYGTSIAPRLPGRWLRVLCRRIALAATTLRVMIEAGLSPGRLVFPMHRVVIGSARALAIAKDLSQLVRLLSAVLRCSDHPCTAHAVSMALQPEMLPEVCRATRAAIDILSRLSTAPMPSDIDHAFGHSHALTQPSSSSADAAASANTASSSVAATSAATAARKLASVAVRACSDCCCSAMNTMAEIISSALVGSALETSSASDDLLPPILRTAGSYRAAAVWPAAEQATRILSSFADAVGQTDPSKAMGCGGQPCSASASALAEPARSASGLLFDLATLSPRNVVVGAILQGRRDAVAMSQPARAVLAAATASGAPAASIADRLGSPIASSSSSTSRRSPSRAVTSRDTATSLSGSSSQPFAWAATAAERSAKRLRHCTLVLVRAAQAAVWLVKKAHLDRLRRVDVLLSSVLTEDSQGRRGVGVDNNALCTALETGVAMLGGSITGLGDVDHNSVSLETASIIARHCLETNAGARRGASMNGVTALRERLDIAATTEVKRGKRAAIHAEQQRGSHRAGRAAVAAGAAAAWVWGRSAMRGTAVVTDTGHLLGEVAALQDTDAASASGRVGVTDLASVTTVGGMLDALGAQDAQVMGAVKVIQSSHVQKATSEQSTEAPPLSAVHAAIIAASTGDRALSALPALPVQTIQIRPAPADVLSIKSGSSGDVGTSHPRASNVSAGADGSGTGNGGKSASSRVRHSSNSGTSTSTQQKHTAAVSGGGDRGGGSSKRQGRSAGTSVRQKGGLSLSRRGGSSNGAAISSSGASVGSTGSGSASRKRTSRSASTRANATNATGSKRTRQATLKVPKP